MKIFNPKKYLSLASSAGFALPLLMIIGFNNYLDNWDSNDVESFVRQRKLGGIFYLDSVRPFYIQRSARQGSVFFYDLNPRIQHSGDASKYLQIKKCLHPDYWIIKSNTRSEHEFQTVKNLFKQILIDRGDIFLARDLAPGVHAESSYNCTVLSMIP